MLDVADTYVRLDFFDPSADRGFASGVLCRRHADAMAVPRGWALDDRRDATPRLFQPRRVVALAERAPTRHPAAARPARRVQPPATPEPALPLDEIAAPAATAVPREAAVVEAADADADATKILAWTPDFAPAEEIEVLRAAQSPLLSRAFRGLRPRA